MTFEAGYYSSGLCVDTKSIFGTPSDSARTSRKPHLRKAGSAYRIETENLFNLTSCVTGVVVRLPEWLFMGPYDCDVLWS